MKRRIIKTVTDSGTALYAVQQKKFFDRNWVTLPFDFGDGEQKVFLNIEELGKFFGWYIPNSENLENRVTINDELREYYDNKVIHEHVQAPYQIAKWNDPEHTRVIDIVCTGKTIQDLSDGEHTFRELNAIREQVENELPTDDTICKIINLWAEYRLSDDMPDECGTTASKSCYEFIRKNWKNIKIKNVK